MKLRFAEALAVLEQQGLLRQHSNFPPHYLGQSGEVVSNSADISKGAIFVASHDPLLNSHLLLWRAMARGASLLVVETPPFGLPLHHDCAWVQVDSGPAALSWLTAAAHGFPERTLRFYGVTGSRGKTSTVWMTNALLAACHVPCLSISKLGLYFANVPLPDAQPSLSLEPRYLSALLAMVAASGGDTVVMALPFQALIHHKLACLRFAAAAFVSMGAPFEGSNTLGAPDAEPLKALLYTGLVQTSDYLILEDSLQQAFTDRSALRSQVKTCWYTPRLTPSPSKEGDDASCLRLESLTTKASHSLIAFRYQGKRFAGSIPYMGTGNCANFLAAWLLASQRVGRGLDSSYWEALEPVPGHLEYIDAQGGRAAPEVVIDHAATAEGLGYALSVLRSLCRGRLWVVFGCDSQRNAGERSMLGAIAAKYADHVVITSDNPRYEDPVVIAHGIKAGILPTLPLEVDVIEKREKAIEHAITSAAPDDIILIAGKGQKVYQIIGEERQAFDDRLVSLRYLQARAAAYKAGQNDRQQQSQL